MWVLLLNFLPNLWTLLHFIPSNFSCRKTCRLPLYKSNGCRPCKQGSYRRFLKIFHRFFRNFFHKRAWEKISRDFFEFSLAQLVVQVTMHTRKIILRTLLNPYWTIIGLFLWWCKKSSKWPKITYEADREIPTSGTRVFKGGEDDG